MTAPVGGPTSLGWNGIGGDLARPLPTRTLAHVPDEGRSTTLVTAVAAPPRAQLEIVRLPDANQRPRKAADQHVRLERTTGFEPATLTLAR